MIDLVTWKTGKDSLNPLGNYPHPLNPELHVIAGHREGCATECPGDLFYNDFSTLRLNVMEAFSDCGYYIRPLSFENEQFDELFFTVSESELIIYHPGLQIDQVCLYDLLGRKYAAVPVENSDNTAGIPIQNFKTGIYILTIYYRSSLLTRKIMILH